MRTRRHPPLLSLRAAQGTWLWYPAKGHDQCEPHRNGTTCHEANHARGLQPAPTERREGLPAETTGLRPFGYRCLPDDAVRAAASRLDGAGVQPCGVSRAVLDRGVPAVARAVFGGRMGGAAVRAVLPVVCRPRRARHRERRAGRRHAPRHRRAIMRGGRGSAARRRGAVRRGGWRRTGRRPCASLRARRDAVPGAWWGRLLSRARPTPRSRRSAA